jgi:GPH family glycoside/pentoside/hexuronide:cation symporter
MNSDLNLAKLSIKEKIGFSFGDAASNLFFQTFVLYLLFFYTDVFGLPSAVAGTMFLITRIWDAINDPIMGMIADSTKTKYGKFRPYILWLAIPFGVIGFFMFITPDFGATGKIIYAYVTYTLMMMIYTAINVPYSALMGVITSNSLERTELSSYRFVAAYVGLLIITGTTESLVEFFGKGDAQVGWQWTMGIFSILAILLWIVTFFTTKERVDPPKDQQTNIKKDGKDLFKNLPWLLIAGATVFQLTYIVVRASIMPYYIKYYIQDHSITLFGETIKLSVSYFLTSGAISTLIGAILTKWLARVFDKKNTYGWSLAISAGSCFVFYFLTPENVAMIYLVNIFSSFFLGPVSVLQWAMYTDAADYGEWKNGRRATGLVMAASLFALKLGVALGGAITGWVLAYYGFIANQVQTSDSINGILVLIGIYTAIIGVIGATLIIFYPLNNKKMVEIENDLKARRAG